MPAFEKNPRAEGNLALAAGFIALAVGATCSAQGVGQATEGEKVIAVNTYSEPKHKDLSGLVFPSNEMRKGREGWVSLQFMVDTQGKPYEIFVIESTGNKILEEAAIKAAQGWTFEPATIDGKPVDASHMIKVKFTIKDSSGAGEAFVKQYRKFTFSLQKANKEQMMRALQQLNAKNLYEDAFLGLAQYEYARLWGTPAEQLQAINRAIAGESSPAYLPRKTFAAALETKLKLQAGASDFAGALNTWRILKEYAHKDSIPELERLIAEIEALRSKSEPYAVEGEIGDSRQWYLPLFRRKFTVVLRTGSVDEVRLRCSTQYVLFKYERNMQYSINERSGDCDLQLIGASGTSFQLVQQ